MKQEIIYSYNKGIAGEKIYTIYGKNNYILAKDILKNLGQKRLLEFLIGAEVNNYYYNEEIYELQPKKYYIVIEKKRISLDQAKKLLEEHVTQTITICRNVRKCNFYLLIQTGETLKIGKTLKYFSFKPSIGYTEILSEVIEPYKKNIEFGSGI